MKKYFLILVILSLHSVSHAKTVKYELTAEQRPANLSGKKTVEFAIMVNGSIPAPTLEFTEGDDAEILVNNRVPNQEISVHWHGILLPPEMDGVPYLTTPPIASGSSFRFSFKLRQSGTYWYHSHTNVQEQKGVYGAFIIHPKVKRSDYDRDVVAVLSDWTDENPDSVIRNLRKDGDYYLHKKGTMRSYWGAIQSGGLSNYLYNEWSRMGGMDYSDVGYDAFLINGKSVSNIPIHRPGERIRLRLINAAASTYFHVSLGNSSMRAISADGIDISPVDANSLLMGMAETYDLIHTAPNGKSIELKITAQDGTGSASAWIGDGEKVAAPVRPFPDMYEKMDHGAHANHANHSPPPKKDEHADHMAHAAHSMPSGPVGSLTVDHLKALQPTVFPKPAKVQELTLELGGDMSRYIWYINGKAIHEEKTITVNAGDVVRFSFVNTTMMHHPMHLHGHFFRVLTAQNEYSPLKHTVDVPPHGSRTIEFLANEPGQWMLHCHNLYHMKNGMGRVVQYLSYRPSDEMLMHQKHDPHNHDHLYYSGMLEAATNHAQASFRLFQMRHEVFLRTELRKEGPWYGEGDLFYRRWLSQYFTVIGGATAVRNEYRGTLGVGYLLPWLLHLEGFVNHKGEFRLDIERRFQWTKHFFSDVTATLRTKLGSEFEVTLMYAPNWNWAVGLMVTDDSFGGGLQFRF